MSEEKNKGGRPPTYETSEKMQAKIDAYFDECQGELFFDEDGETPLRTSKGELLYKRAPTPLTVTGLAEALGFTSRQALINYEAKEEFVDTVMRAKLKIEKYTEMRLFDKDGVNGAKFSLANNFRGWKEKQEVKADVGIKIDLGDAEKFGR